MDEEIKHLRIMYYRTTDVLLLQSLACKHCGDLQKFRAVRADSKSVEAMDARMEAAWQKHLREVGQTYGQK